MAGVQVGNNFYPAASIFRVQRHSWGDATLHLTNGETVDAGKYDRVIAELKGETEGNR